MAKIILDYSKQSDSDFANTTLEMVNALTGNSNFGLPWPTEYPTLAAFTAKQKEFADKVTAAGDRDKAKVAAKNACRDELQAMVRDIGRYLQTKSGGDRAILETTGFDIAKTPDAPMDVPDAPADLKLKLGKTSGTIIASAKMPKGAASIETWSCVGDPNVEANWKLRAQTSSARTIEVSGLQRGVDTYVKCRAIGRKGPGPWSDVATIMPV